MSLVKLVEGLLVPFLRQDDDQFLFHLGCHSFLTSYYAAAFLQVYRIFKTNAGKFLQGYFFYGSSY